RANRSSATCCSCSSQTSVSPPWKSWAPLLSSSQAPPPPQSPASPCRSMAIGPRTRARGLPSATREENMLDVSSTRYVERGRKQAEAKPGQERLEVVLVFQGGGALGAYQAGVYQALHESGVEPDWVIGTSIGAINASLIAGNELDNRVERLEEFWRRMRRKEFWGLSHWPGLA